MNVSIDSYDLCGGALTGSISELRQRVTRFIDIILSLGTANPYLLDRGDRQTQITFNVTYNHASIKEADLFIFNRENTIPQAGDIEIVSTHGTTSKLLENGLLIDHHLISQIGTTTVHSYHLTGGRLTTG